MQIKADQLLEPARLDVFVNEHFPALSRSSIQKLIDTKHILVNGQSVKNGYSLKQGDVITIDYDETEVKIPQIDLPIIYEDADCIVINKPVGVLTHSKGAFNPEATVASFIAPKVSDITGDRAGIVHRLDRATSGVIICAKNEAAQSWLQKQFAQRKTKKEYTAAITTGLKPQEAIINMPIERDPDHPKQFRVGSNGKPAQTTYKVIKEGSKYALVELKPFTGRTHQLRVHLKQLKHPIVGDRLYGGEPAPRLMLHAKSLEVTLPNRQRKVFSATLPSEFTSILN